MGLIRISGQKGTFEERYAQFVNQDGADWEPFRRAMLAYIERLDTALGDKQVWALTSHESLKLAPNDDSLDPFLAVLASDDGSYLISYPDDPVRERFLVHWTKLV